MDETTTYIVDMLTNTDPGTLLVVIILISALLFTNRTNIINFFETYITGKRAMTREERKSASHTDELIKVLTDMKSDITKVQDLQSVMLTNQGRMQDNIQDLQRQVDENNELINKKIEYVSEQCDFLKICDKEDKKAYITREYNYFYIRLGKIDLYSKSTLEKIYDLYLRENGDTFVAGMMSQIRTLPTVSQITEIDSRGPTQPEIDSVDPLSSFKKGNYADSHN